MFQALIHMSEFMFQGLSVLMPVREFELLERQLVAMELQSVEVGQDD